MSDYKMGDGARTLRWVPGMKWIAVDSVSGEEYEGRCELEVEPTLGCRDIWSSEWPDLTDRATFLLALDQLAERIKSMGGFSLSRSGFWAVGKYQAHTAEALDRALYETQEQT